jgi:fructosamine-3-kinase
MAKVTFTNEPRFSEHTADQKFNDRKKSLVPLVGSFVVTHALFSNVDVSITFFHTGVSSLVCLFDTFTKKYVFKVPLSILDSGLEATFLKTWEQSGVTVPHVFEDGLIGNHRYTLMEHIDAPILGAKYSKEELLEMGVYRQLGTILKKMHQVKTSGFSNVVNDKSEPQYLNITSWITGDIRMNDQIKFVKENLLLNDEEHGSLEKAFEIIISKIDNNTETVCCHNDFNINNIFATNPFTVFDPWPCFHHPYMDLSRAIVISSLGTAEIAEQLIEGYSENIVIDRQLLQAFILLNIYVKIKYQIETGNSAGVKSMKDYLSSTKHFLTK